MNLLSSSLCQSLPLNGGGTIERQPDWVRLWEQWARKGPSVLLESAGQASDAGRWVILAGHPEMEFFGREGRLWTSNGSKTVPAALDVWKFLDEAGKTEMGFSPLPFCLARAWFGVFSYEFGESFTFRNRLPKAPASNAVPDFYFFKPQSVLAYDRKARQWHYFGRKPLENLEPEPPPTEPFRVHSLQALLRPEHYVAMARAAQAYIASGDIYQANLAQAFQAHWGGSAGSLYRLLREMNPGPFMGIFQGREFTIVSSSPERLAAGQGHWLETRPIAGTRPRGKDHLQDLQLQWELKTNPKEQAEHLMLVDLARNDLGKVSQYGTVEAKSFAHVESYARVHHLVSVLQGRRCSSATMSHLLRSFFPGGTITGCPKIRCMEIIAELEKSPRGFYTGSMGYVASGPCFDFNILIRSLTLLPDGKLEFFAGAGIVADSDPEKEYLETLYKVEALAQALGTSFLSKA